MASHFVTDTTADAAPLVHTFQAPQPNPRKAPPTQAPHPVAPPHAPDRERMTSRPEPGERRVTEHIDRSKRDELCKKLEQRREQLRQEKKAERRQEAE